MKTISQNLLRLGEYSGKMAQGDYDAVYEYFGDDFFTHVTERVKPDMVGKDVRGEERIFWEAGKNAFDNYEFKVNLLVESGDIIVSNWSITGIHSKGPYYGIPPSGKPVHINGTAIMRMKDGKVVEHWGGPHCMDGIGLHKQC